MTNADMVATAPAPSTASTLDDIIEIFYRPSAVFARRRSDPRFWGAFLVLVILMTLLSYLMLRNLSTVMDAEFARQRPEIMRRNPGLTEEQLNRGRGLAPIFGTLGVAFVTLVGVFVLALGTWLVGKLLDGDLRFSHGMVIATLASLPKILDPLLASVMAMTLGTEGIPSMVRASPSLARFVGATNPFVLGLLSRISVGTIWATILVAIGLHVMGRIPKGRAYAGALVLWLVGTALAGVMISRQP